MDLEVIALLIVAYLLGSVPFGLVLGKMMGAGDIRKIGSGNIGATNALRTGNKKLALLTLIMDILKGTLAVLIMKSLMPDYAMLAGLMAVIGHMFPVWLKFKGGKGVATALGILLGLNFVLFITTVAIWFITFKFSKISSLSALTAFALAPMFAFIYGDMTLALMLLVLGVLIFVKHRENIARLTRGEEPQFKSTRQEERDEPADESQP